MKFFKKILRSIFILFKRLLKTFKKLLVNIVSFNFLKDVKGIKRKAHISKKRTRVVFVGLFLVFAIWILIINIGSMSVLGKARGVNLSEVAEEKYTVERIIEAERGRIFDRNGEVLADNVASYKLVAVLSESASEGLKENEEKLHVVDKSKTAEELAKYIKLEKSAIENLLNTQNAYQVEFGNAGRDIDVVTKKKIEELKLSGIKFETSTKRYYPNASVLGNFLGFAHRIDENSKINGRLGIEKVFDHYLRGENGKIVYGKDAWGKIVSNLPIDEQKVVNGSDIHLTIDANIQRYVDQTLADIQDKYDPELAFAYVMSAKTGELLAIGQTPAFNPNTMENLDTAWTNSLYNSAIEPGSTMKTYTLAVMMEHGLYDPNKYFRSGSYRVADTVIYDHNKVGWGTITYAHGFQESSNTLMLTMLNELGDEKLQAGFEKFGFGKTTNSLFDSEASGRLEFDNVVSAASSSFGQGSTVTPIQMLQAETAIVNEGQMLRPYFLKNIYDRVSGRIVNEGKKEIIGQPISKETSEKVKDELYGVVNGKWASGGARYKVEGYSVAGKTGTAEVANPNTGKYYTDKYKVIQSFMGYAPSDNPEIIVYAAMKSVNKNKEEGYAQAVKGIFPPIVSNTLEYLGIEKDGSETIKKEVHLESYRDKTVSEVLNILQNSGINTVQIGNGEKVVKQYPEKDNIVIEGEKLFLLTDGQEFKVPNFKNWSKSEVLKFGELTGISININGNGYVKEQSILPGKVITTVDTLIVNLS